MKYKVVIFGVKDTTAEIVTFIQEKICPVDLVVTIHPDVLSGNQVSGYQGLGFLTEKYGIPVFETHSYGLKDEETARFFDGNEFEIGISMGWAAADSPVRAGSVCTRYFRLPRKLRLSALRPGAFSAELVGYQRGHPGLF